VVQKVVQFRKSGAVSMKCGADLLQILCKFFTKKYAEKPYRKHRESGAKCGAF